MSTYKIYKDSKLVDELQVGQYEEFEYHVVSYEKYVIVTKEQKKEYDKYIKECSDRAYENYKKGLKS